MGERKEQEQRAAKAYEEQKIVNEQHAAERAKEEAIRSANWEKGSPERTRSAAIDVQINVLQEQINRINLLGPSDEVKAKAKFLYFAAIVLIVFILGIKQVLDSH